MAKFEYDYNKNDPAYSGNVSRLLTALASYMASQKCSVTKDFSKYHLRYIRRNKDGKFTDEPAIKDGQKFSYNSLGEEFIDALKNGEVYMYPNNKKTPVKLTMIANDEFKSLSFTVRADPVPMNIKRPHWFHRWMHSWFGAYKDEFDRYERQQCVTASEERRTQEIGVDEAATYEKNDRMAQYAIDKQAFLKEQEILEGCFDRMEAILGPNTVAHPTLVKYGVLTQDYQLDPYVKPDIFSDLEASELVFAAYADPAHGGMQVAQNVGEPNIDVHGNYSFVAEGFFSAYRQNIGERGYNPGLNSARAATAAAMKKYAEGDPTDLARIISCGIKENNLNVNAKQNVSTTVAVYAKMNGGLLDLMAKHPDLKEAALKNGFLSNADLEYAEGALGLVDLQKKNVENRIKMQDALLEERELSREEKMEINMNHLQIDVISIEMGELESNWTNCEEFKSLSEPLSEKMEEAYMKGDAKQGRLYGQQIDTLKTTKMPVNNTIKNLNKPETLKKITEVIMETDLFQKRNDMSVEDIMKNNDVTARLKAEIDLAHRPPQKPKVPTNQPVKTAENVFAK